MEAAMIKILVRVVLLVVCLSGCAAAYNAKYPLHAAAYSGNTDVCRRFLESGAPIDSRDGDNMTPLHAAVLYNHYDTALFLLQKGATVDTIEEEGNPLLASAAANCNSRMIKMLLDAGAKADIINFEGNSVLHFAAEGCADFHEDSGATAALLLNTNVNINAVDRNGLTAYDYAVSSRSAGLIAGLRQHGFDKMAIGDGAFEEALKKPSFYKPDFGTFIVPPGSEKRYFFAIADCNQLIIPNKKGLLFAAGPVGYAAGLIYDQVKIKYKFNNCMEVMGFKIKEPLVKTGGAN
jgi:hypothetical protein